jgi:hypothetical protein
MDLLLLELFLRAVLESRVDFWQRERGFCVGIRRAEGGWLGKEKGGRLGLEIRFLLELKIEEFSFFYRKVSMSMFC